MKKITLIIGTILLFGFAPEWIHFENREGGFTILFPRQPMEKEDEINSIAGKTTMKMFMYDASKYKDDNEFYAVDYLEEMDPYTNSDMQDVAIDGLLHTSLANGAKKMSAKITGEHTVFLKGYRGREGKFYVAHGNYYLLMRAFLVHRRMYILQVAYKPNHANNPSIGKFFNSFDVSAQKKTAHELQIHNNWTVIQKNGFKVFFPEEPKESEQHINSKEGLLETTVLAYSTGKYLDDNEGYILTFTDYTENIISSDFKDELTDAFFDKAIHAMVSKMGYRTLSEKKIRYMGYPGRSLKVMMADKGTLISMQIYLVKSRLYGMEVIYPAKKDHNPNIDKFFKSFELVGGN